MRKLWYLTAICLIVIGIAGAISHDWNSNEKDMKEYEKEWTFSAEELRELSIASDYDVGMTFVKSSDGRNSIRLNGRGTERMISEVRNASIADRALKLELIRKPKRFVNFFNFAFGANRQELIVSVTDDALLDRLKLKLDAGNISLKDAALMKLGAVELDSDSGNLTLNNFRSDTLEIDLDSGNIRGNEVAANLKASLDSGNVTLEKVTGKVELSADSGNIRLTKLDSADTDISADSGNVYVRVPADFAGSYDVKTGSGRVRAPESKHETTDYVKVRAGSGNITVELP